MGKGKGKGRGWHDDKERHRLAAIGIPTAAGAQAWKTESAAHERKLQAGKHAEKIMNQLHASGESVSERVEMHVGKAIEQMEEVVLGPKLHHRARWPSEKEYSRAFDIVDSQLSQALDVEKEVGLKKQLRDARTATRIARNQLPF